MSRFIVRQFAVTVALLSIAGLAACGNGTMLRRSPRMGTATSVATSADVRLVTTTPVDFHEDDFVRPRQVTCAEPSPDVAKIVTQAFGSGSALGVRGRSPNFPASGDLNTTLALSKSYAEGIAQMTERLATIQLLRDGLYRACEAYSNGAISATTYSAMVSRFDKTMITMLMGELAAGNFGRTLAALGGSSSSKASAELAIEQATKRERDTKENMERKESEKRNIESQIAATPATEENAEERQQLLKRNDELAHEVSNAREDHRKAEESYNATLKASAESAAETTATAAGAISKVPEAAAAIAADLVQIQANYLNDHNLDAIKIACLNSWGREQGQEAAIDRYDKNGARIYRYPYQRGLSVFCDELVQTLKRDVAATREAAAKAGGRAARAAATSGGGGTRAVDPAMKTLFMTEPQAVGPFDVEWEKVRQLE